jgi:hypothetical protein
MSTPAGTIPAKQDTLLPTDFTVQGSRLPPKVRIVSVRAVCILPDEAVSTLVPYIHCAPQCGVTTPVTFVMRLRPPLRFTGPSSCSGGPYHANLNILSFYISSTVSTIIGRQQRGTWQCWLEPAPYAEFPRQTVLMVTGYTHHGNTLPLSCSGRKWATPSTLHRQLPRVAIGRYCNLALFASW